MKPEEEGDKSIEFCEETQTIRVYRQEEDKEHWVDRWFGFWFWFWGIVTLIPMTVLIGLE